MVVNVARFNKAMKPLLEEPEETDAYRDAAAAVSSIGAGLGAYMKQNMAIKKEEREEQAIIDQQQREKERQKALFDREEKSKAVLDFANFQGEMTNTFDKLQSSDKLDYIKECNNAFISGKEKNLKGKSASYRTAFSQLATDYYAKVSPELVKTNAENTQIREAANIENAAKAFIDNNNDPEILNNLDNFLNGQIDEMDVKDWQKDMMKRQSSKMFTIAAFKSMVQQNPDAALTYIENDPKVNSLMSDKEIDGLRKICDDAKFNQFADQNPVGLYQTMLDTKKAKETFTTMDDKEISRYQSKAKKIYDNHNNYIKQQNEIRRYNIISSFQNDPTTENLEKVKLAVPDLKQTEIDDMEAAVDFVKDNTAKTLEKEVYPVVEELVEVLNNAKVEDPNDLINISSEFMKIKKTLMGYNNKKIMSAADYDKYTSLMNVALHKEMIEQINDTKPLLQPLLREGKKVSLPHADKYLFSYQIEEAKKHRFTQHGSTAREMRSIINDEKIAELVNSTIANYLMEIEKGNREGAIEIINNGKKSIAELKYPEIKGLQKGDFLVKNNVVYTFEGLNGTDAIISVK